MSFEESYRYVKIIKSGGEGTVSLCEHNPTKELVAVKEITVRTKEDFNDQREAKIVNILQQHPHKNIIKMREVFYDENERQSKYTTYIAMELGKYSTYDLFTDYARQNKTFSEDEILDMVEQITEALLHFKQLDLFHRDLKPDNVIVFEEGDQSNASNNKKRVYKVSDFGCGKDFNRASNNRGMSVNAITGFVGTPQYYSPEFKKYFEYIEGLSQQQQLEFVKEMIVPDYEKADVWTIGFMALQAALASRKNENGQEIKVLGMNNWRDYDRLMHIVLNYVPHEKVKGLLLDVLGKQSNQSRPGFLELLQRVRALRQAASDSGMQPGTAEDEPKTMKTKLVLKDDDRVTKLLEEVQRLQKELEKYQGEDEKKIKQKKKKQPQQQQIETNTQVQQQNQAQAQSNSTQPQQSEQQQPNVEYFLRRISPSAKYVDFKGHSSTVWSVAFSADGQLLASGSQDNKLKLWSVDAQKEVASLQGKSGEIYSVAFSADGKLLASGNGDKTVRLWSLDTKREVGTLYGHSRAVSSVAFSPDAKFLASASVDKTVKLWNVNTQKDIEILQGHANLVNSVAFSADGKLLASGSSDNTVKLWSVDAPYKEVATLQGHSGYVWTVAFSPDGKFFASGSSDNTVKLWSVNAPHKEVVTLKGHSGEVRSVAFSADGKFLASGSGDCTVKLWSVDAQQQVVTLKGHSRDVFSTAFSQDGKYLASCGYDQLIKLWGVQ